MWPLTTTSAYSRPVSKASPYHVKIAGSARAVYGSFIGILLLLSIGYFATGGPSVHIFGLLLVACLLAWSYRIWRSGIWISAQGVAIVSHLRNRTFSWDRVVRFSYTERPVGVSTVPRLVVTLETGDKGVIPIGMVNFSVRRPQSVQSLIASLNSQLEQHANSDSA